MLNVLGKAMQVAVDIATTPIAVAADVATMGGALTDKDEPYTVTKAKRIAENSVEIVDKIAS